MWNLRKKQLDGPLAFYKIGHHGSINATPWGMTPSRQQRRTARHSRCHPADEVESKGQGGRFDASGNYPTIPRSDLLAEIGKRVSNTKNYADAFKKAGKKTSDVPKFGEFEEKSFAKPQPLRTDLERILVDSTGFVDVEIDL